MRLGCEATAIDINPVAWFVLKCTLEYPQKLAGQKRPLPDFILNNAEFMKAFRKAHGLGDGSGLFDQQTTEDTKRKKKPSGSKKSASASSLPSDSSASVANSSPLADLAWHVRAWGQWVLRHARKELAKFYPTYADFEPLDPNVKSFEKQPMRLVRLKDDGTPNMIPLNGEFSADYLAVKGNPRWVAKPTVAYFWAKTVTCKNCRATIPLLKTRWLCKRDRKRVLLTMEANHEKTGVVFAIETDVPAKGSNAAQKREHDKKLGKGTMSRAGADCPCCGLKGIMTMEDIRVRGKGKELHEVMTAVVVDGLKGKEYRLPTDHEQASATDAANHIDRIFADVPFGVPDEPTPAGGGTGAGRAFSVQGYGLMKWRDLFTPRQLLALGVFVRETQAARAAMAALHQSAEWIEAVGAYLACGFDRMLDFNGATLSWISSVEAIGHTFVRYALPMTWDYSEAAPINGVRGGWEMCLGAVMESGPTLLQAGAAATTAARALKQSATQTNEIGVYDAIVTDPPYYDAIPYSDLMDYFYIWLRRTLYGLSAEIDATYADAFSSKWDHEKNDGELIDDASRHNNDAAKSKQIYEDGMARVFVQCAAALKPEGRLVIVFANKQPDAWETLAAAIIRAGFVIDGSWPIQTEQAARMRAQSSAALASSIWLVGKKRPATARPGWDNKVLDEMRANIGRQLREFWDAGIRGPDFVWAATGPALEAYSKHPVVKMADEPGKVMTVSDFLSHARRMVVDFVVGRVLSGGDDDAPPPTMDRLDEPTAYYLLHRHDFGLDDAPAGACILYATACGLSDEALIRDWDLIVKTGGDDAADDEEDEEGSDESEEPSEESGSGSKVKLKAWNHRRGRSLGLEAPGGRPVPLIDRIHRLMHLWKGGDVHKVDEYLDEHGLRRHELFRRVLQSLIELSRTGSEERSLLESLSNHVGAKGAKKKDPQPLFLPADDDDE